MRATFSSSYQALPEEARQLFAALATFASPEMGRKAVAAVAQTLEEMHDKAQGSTEASAYGSATDLLVRRALVDAAVNETLVEEGRTASGYGCTH